MSPQHQKVVLFHIISPYLTNCCQGERSIDLTSTSLQSRSFSTESKQTYRIFDPQKLGQSMHLHNEHVRIWSKIFQLQYQSVAAVYVTLKHEKQTGFNNYFIFCYTEGSARPNFTFTYESESKIRGKQKLSWNNLKHLE